MSLPLQRKREPSLPRDFSRRPKRSRSQSNGGGRRADPHEIESLFKPQSSSATPVFDGVTYGVNGFGSETVQLLHNRPFHFPSNLRQKNTLIIGQDRECLEDQILEPLISASLRNRRSSIVLFVPPGDMYEKLFAANQRFRPDISIERLSFSDRNRSTATWSVIETVDPKRPFEVLDEVRRLVVLASTHLEGVGEFLLTPICQLTAVLLCRFHERFQKGSLADVYHALHLPQVQLTSILKTGATNSLATSVVQMFESDDCNSENLLKEARTALHAFHDKSIASVTATTSLSASDLLVRPRVLVVEVPYVKRTLVLPLIRFFVEKLLGQAGAQSVSSTNKHPRHLSLFFDAASLTTDCRHSLNPISMDLLRASRVDVIATASSVRSLASLFRNQADVLLEQFQTKIFQSPLDVNDANWASYLTGQTTIESYSHIEEPDNFQAATYRPTSRVVHSQMRPVIESEQVRFPPRLPKSGPAATVFLPETRPFQVWFPQHHDSESKHQAKTETRSRKRNSAVIPVWSPMLDDSDPTASEAQTSAEVAESQYQNHKKAIFARGVSNVDRTWWQSNEVDRPKSIRILARELAQRTRTITEFRTAVDESGTVNVSAVLGYLDFQQHKDRV